MVLLALNGFKMKFQFSMPGLVEHGGDMAMWLVASIWTCQTVVLSDGMATETENSTLLSTLPMSPDRIAELKCQEEILNSPAPKNGELFCNRTWDGWGCWDPTPAGGRAFIQCPSFVEGFDADSLAYKDCTVDGTWWISPYTNHTWANYTGCLNFDDLDSGFRMVNIFVVGYSISIIALSVSLIIFFSFRQLHCDRITLHKNLFFSYILNGTAWILYYMHAAVKSKVLQENYIWCQVLHVLTQYFVACNYFWMFCEGLYLHTVIVFAFVRGKHLVQVCYVIGWCLPLITTTIYATTRPLLYPGSVNQCWIRDHHLQWIVLGPVIVTLLLNLVFLCNIVRVLVTKMQAVNSPDTNQTRKAVRATLILIPLLGLQYLLIPFQPPDGTKAYEVYLHWNAVITSSQGLLVAVIFCFLNGEVITAIKRKWSQRRQMANSRLKRSGGVYEHTTVTLTDAGVANSPNIAAIRGSPEIADTSLIENLVKT